MSGNKMKITVLLISISFILSITFFTLFKVNSNLKANELEMAECFEKEAGISLTVERKIITSKTTVSCDDN
ncbi:hypothetical protein ACFSFY_00930 [Sporosarcina siberiensis]|uniref:Uncharacterized protein n=1 Tax=Sporosarcina siberiensis TaxID=1365606 RepID=A0ABW4SCW2_9BACL